MIIRADLAWPLTLALAVSASAQTADLKWHKDVRKDVDEAERVADADPVSAHRLLQHVQTAKKPSAPQAAWLEQRLSALRPRAIEVLQRDYDAAAKAGDLRGVLLAAANGDAIEAGALRKEPPVEEVRKKALAADASSGLWKITDLTATTAKGYGEGGTSGFSVVVPKGSQVLRVHGRVENVDDGSDPVYTLWALGSLKRLMGAMFAPAGPHRWVDQDLIFLANPAGELIACAVIGKDSDLATMQLRTAGGQLVFPPKGLKRGESVKLDAIFVVPQGAADYRLFIVGAPPVPVPAPSAL